ncbi:MAG: DUF202 domain-containing protein [Deltaproteobacteria bacterium]|nr:DUF202 domain-containing protein [Deltaproteobacteria bacterium]
MEPLSTNQLALERTFLAQERTLLAWVRTALSLITFGFAVYKFFGLEHALEPGHPASAVLGSRAFSLLLIGLGLVTLVFASLEHRRTILLLRRQFGAIPRSLAGKLGVLIALLGLAAFLAVLLRV